MYSDYAIQTMTTNMQYETATSEVAPPLAVTQPLYGDAFGYVARLGQSAGDAEEQSDLLKRKKSVPKLRKTVRTIAKTISNS